LALTSKIGKYNIFTYRRPVPIHDLQSSHVTYLKAYKSKSCVNSQAARQGKTEHDFSNKTSLYEITPNNI
jgi:hypothetical protein